MRKQINIGSKIVYVGDYTTEIPFYIELFVTEHLLDTPDLIEPALEREGTSPLVGATALYRLIADGSTAPTFSSNLTRSSKSLEYDVTQGVVNLIEFYYDGETFWYTIINGLAPVETAIVDKGEGNTTLSLSIRAVNITINGEVPNQIARVTVADMLVAVGYTGTEPILYSIGTTNGNPPFVVLSSNLDPALAYIDFNCDNLGTNGIFVQVETQSLSCPVSVATATIQDTSGFCGN